MTLVTPFRMDDVRARRLLLNKYNQEKRFYAIFRISNSGQCLMSRIEKDKHGEFILSNIPVYYEKDAVTVGKDKTLSTFEWDSYLYELLLDNSLLGDLDL